jgi:hypothetical protein
MKPDERLLAKLKAAAYAIAAEYGSRIAIVELQSVIDDIRKDQWDMRPRS